MNLEAGGSARPSGDVALRRQVDLGDLQVQRVSLGWRLRNLVTNRRKTIGQVAAANFTGRVFGFVPIMTKLSGAVYRPDFARLTPEQLLRLKVKLQARVDLTTEQLVALQMEIAHWPSDVRDLAGFFGGQVLEYGVLGQRVITTAGVGFIVDAHQNLVELENLKYHGFGTGTNNENASDSALQTELTTEYVTNNTRPTGTTTEGASANIYRTVATLSPDSGGTLAITEHGIFDQASNAGGVLLDRTKFSAVNLTAGADSLQATYEATYASGG